MEGIATVFPAKLPEPVFHRVLAGVLAQHDIVGLNAKCLRRHDLVSLLVRQDSVLMDPGFVREGIPPYDRFVERSGLADDVINSPAGAGNLHRINPSSERIKSRPCTHSHNHFFQSSVPCPFSETVYGAFDLSCATQHAGE